MNRIIDLSGPDGNAFVIRALARNWAKQLQEVNNFKYEPKQMLDKFSKCKSYNEILDIFDSYFKDTTDYKFLNDPREDDNWELNN